MHAEALDPIVLAITLAPDLSEVARGRGFLSRIAVEAGFSEERVFDITVACSEAMANAIEHSPVKGEVRVRAVMLSDRLEVEVEGPGEFQTPDRLKERSGRGLGLPLMAKLSDHVALFSGPAGGTFVSLTFYRPGIRAEEAGPRSPSFVDLTDQAPEEALSCGDTLFRSALRHSPVSLAAQDRDLRYIWSCNRDSAGSADLTGKTDHDLFPAQAGLLTAIKRDVIEQGAERHERLWLDGPDGRLFVDLHCQPMRDDAGRVNGVLLTTIDQTEQRWVEEAFRRSEAHLAYLVELDDALLTVDDADEIMQVAAGLLAGRLGAGPVFTGVAPTAGQTTWSADVDNDPAFSPETSQLFRERSVRAFIEVPLMEQGVPAAVLRVWHHEPRAWTREDVTLAEQTAGRAWIAAQHARAEEALRKSEERYRAIAEQLQSALLDIPSEIGPVKVGHLYHSATEAARVGGDFYDVFEVKDGKIAVLVGDVSGHGIQAARTATLVKDVIHAFTHQSVRPHEVLKRTNAMLVEKDLQGFVSLFLGILDPKSGDFRYASAGHPETLLRRATGEVLMLGAGSAPLGVFPDAQWKPGVVELEVGDILLLYTDGALEARRGTEMFGRARLQALLRRKRLSVQRLPHMVLDQVLAFSEGTLQDDVAVLALSLSGRPPRPSRQFEQGSLLD